jgi:hypothetical protein
MAPPANVNPPLDQVLATPPVPGRLQVLPDQSREPAQPPREVGGREGPEPTRYGDWEMRGRCIDF